MKKPMLIDEQWLNDAIEGIEKTAIADDKFSIQIKDLLVKFGIKVKEHIQSPKTLVNEAFHLGKDLKVGSFPYRELNTFLIKNNI